MPKKATKKQEPSESKFSLTHFFNNCVPFSVEVDDKKPEAGKEASDEEVDGEDEEVSDEEDDELMKDDTDEMEKLNFDFEALPLDTSDVEGLVNLLTQIFLRTNVDCEAVAKALVEMSPLGCVYKVLSQIVYIILKVNFQPAEEVMDEDSENAVYGVLSMFELGGSEVCASSFRCLFEALFSALSNRNIKFIS